MVRHNLYLFCYDIADPKRLNRVARYLMNHAYRVQYSVFAAEKTVVERDAIIAHLRSLINEKEDDVRVYPVPPQGEVTMLGRQLFPEDILLLNEGKNILKLQRPSPGSYSPDELAEGDDMD